MSTGTVVLSIVLTFLTTGILANWLVYKWQHRNWLNQQKFLGSEKKYEALKAHAEALSIAASSRHSAMIRLTASLKQTKAEMETRLAAYSETLDDWNKQLNGFYFKTTMYMNFTMTRRLENDIQKRFFLIGKRLESAVRERRLDIDLNSSEHEAMYADLNALQGVLGNFHRDALRIVMTEHAATYFGTTLSYKESDLCYFSTWQLFKALFISRVDEHRIILSSFELEAPAVRGSTRTWIN